MIHTWRLQVAFKVKEELTSQLLHYDVSVGAYMQLDQPRELVQEALALLIPRPVAEEVPRITCCLPAHACADAPGRFPSSDILGKGLSDARSSLHPCESPRTCCEGAALRRYCTWSLRGAA